MKEASVQFVAQIVINADTFLRKSADFMVIAVVHVWAVNKMKDLIRSWHGSHSFKHEFKSTMARTDQSHPLYGCFTGLACLIKF